ADPAAVVDGDEMAILLDFVGLNPRWAGESQRWVLLGPQERLGFRRRYLRFGQRGLNRRPQGTWNDLARNLPPVIAGVPHRVGDGRLDRPRGCWFRAGGGDPGTHTRWRDGQAGNPGPGPSTRESSRHHATGSCVLSPHGYHLRDVLRESYPGNRRKGWRRG